MSTIAELLGNALDKLTQLNSGTLTYNGQSVTVFKSFLRNQVRSMSDFGYDDSYDDLYVLVRPESIESWDLQPLKTQLKLDGVDYFLGKTTTTTPGYVTLWLRKKI